MATKYLVELEEIFIGPNWVEVKLLDKNEEAHLTLEVNSETEHHHHTYISKNPNQKLKIIRGEV